MLGDVDDGDCLRRAKTGHKYSCRCGRQNKLLMVRAAATTPKRKRRSVTRDNTISSENVKINEARVPQARHMHGSGQAGGWLMNTTEY